MAKPIEKIRRGNITAAIWQNTNKDNVTWYSVTVSRSYKDDSGKWADSDSFSVDDLLVVAEVIRLAWHRVHKLRDDDYAAKKEASQS